MGGQFLHSPRSWLSQADEANFPGGGTCISLLTSKTSTAGTRPWPLAAGLAADLLQRAEALRVVLRRADEEHAEVGVERHLLRVPGVGVEHLLDHGPRRGDPLRRRGPNV